MRLPIICRPTLDDPPQHQLTVPAHGELKAGTLSAILSAVAERLGTSRELLWVALKL